MADEPRSLPVPPAEPAQAQSVGLAVPSLPGRLVGGSGIAVSLTGMNYAVNLDIAELTAAVDGNPAPQWFAMWREGTPATELYRVQLNAILTDAPSDGLTYGRRNGDWFDVSGSITVAWAAITGKPATFPPTLPIAQSGVTGLTTSLATLASDITTLNAVKLGDAPNNATGYVRKGAAWSAAVIQAEPLNDGKQYARKGDSTWSEVASAVPPVGYIDGLTLQNNGADANNDIDIFTGLCVDDTGLVGMALTSTLTKRLDAAWAVGSSNGGLDTGAEAVSTWYHVWLIKRPDTGVVDALFSTSATAPTMPANYTLKRRIGAVFNNASGNLDTFLQLGDDFLWLTNPTPNVNSVALVSANGTLFTLLVPPGFNFEAVVNFWFADSAANQVYLSSPLVPDLTASATAGRADALNPGSGGQKRLLTDTSGRIRARGASGTTGQIYIATVGWRDRRGKR